MNKDRKVPVGYRKPHLYVRAGVWAVSQVILGKPSGDMTPEFSAAAEFSLRKPPYWSRF